MQLQHHLKSYKNHKQLLSRIPKQRPVSWHKFFTISEFNKTKLIDITNEIAIFVSQQNLVEGSIAWVIS